MSLFNVLVGLLPLFFNSITAFSTFTPTRPPSIPLAVKSPYLSTWLPAGSDRGNSSGGYLPGRWPTFWTGQVIGWTGLVRVDGRTYTWMGAPPNIKLADQVAFEYTSTKSIFTIKAGNQVSVKVTFLSPLSPSDFRRQSLVFSYMDVEVTSTDNRVHQVQVYTDISAEWVSGDLGAVAQWDYGTTNGTAYHRVWKQQQGLFQEVNDRAEWGNIYYATRDAGQTSFQSGVHDVVRDAFIQTGHLPNAKNTNFRAISLDWPVFGFAVDLGMVGRMPVSTLFTIGLCQEKAINFDGKGGMRDVPSLWKGYFRSELEALTFFYDDFSDANKISTELDEKIKRDSIAASGKEYHLLTSLAARQAFGAVQLVGTLEKHYLFLKEISSNGNTQTVDVIYPASPIFYYLNPELVRLLLEPHFEVQEAGLYPNKWAIHDLGAHYPNATGHRDGGDEPMPLEECGNNIIMVLAYVQRSGNTDYIRQHYPLLSQWAEYLVKDSLYPASQLSTDDFAGHLSNQTNLALKGMIGLQAMSEIATIANNPRDAERYNKTAHEYITQWQTLGINHNDNPPHSILNYNNMTTHGLLYNLFNDRLVRTNLIPPSIYAQQSAFYPTVKQNFGVPLDTRNRYYTKADWEMFCAAVASEETRDMFVSNLARWVGETATNLPFTDLYETSDGRFPAGIEFKARPVMGGMFALLVV
ncbi:glutaminase GtaA [Dendryphion nanum]|uniref:Glutaminase GtaA n=1 Tax=Dendryphion nanum TaxID=256645 RepID=A0A9P9J2M1_9PLEO|nr:glutaminase GtaA [Dendryphion nanum]